MLQRGDEPAYFLRIHAPVGVQHDDDVSGGRSEPGPYGETLAGVGFRDHHHVEAQGTGDVHRAVQ